MSVGFGFSVGDFIAAIELVGTVIDALRSSGSARFEYRELVGQLLSLENALIQVKDLEFEESQYSEVIALQQAAAQCRATIDGFWEKAKKYQPSLGNSGSGSMRAKEKWMKIRWAVCKKDDIARFKADLVGHTESILVLLNAIQMKQVGRQDERQMERVKSLAGTVQEGFFACMQRLSEVTGQGKQLLKTTTQILTINVKIFQVVLQMQNLITTIPGQVERQQPVYMLDAMGRTSPFHLEFIRSAEALICVLQVNFKKYGNGAIKIERGEFVLQDSATGHDVDLTADWDTCFRPGQHVEMSMIVSEARAVEDVSNTDLDCPRCGSECTRSAQLTCQDCGLHFHTSFQPKCRPMSQTTPARDLNEESKFPDRDEVGVFQRVRLQIISQTPTKPMEQTSPRLGTTSKRALEAEETDKYDRGDSPESPSKLETKVRAPKRSSMAGWWACCQCQREVNSSHFGCYCADCGHEQCAYCKYL